MEKRKNNKKLFSALAICAMLNCTLINDAIAEQIWSPAVQSGDITINENLKTINYDNYYSGKNGGKLSINGNSSNELGDFNIFSSGFTNINGQIEIKNDLTIGYDSELFSDGDIIINNALKNEGIISGLKYSEDADPVYGFLSIKNGGYSNGVIKQNVISFNGGTFENTDIIDANTIGLFTDTFDNEKGANITAGALSNTNFLNNAGEIIVDKLINAGTIDGIADEYSPSYKTYGVITIKKDSSSTGSITQDSMNILGGTFSNDTNSSINLRNSLTVEKEATVDNKTSITIVSDYMDGKIQNRGTINSYSGSNINVNTLENTGTINLTNANLEINNQQKKVDGTINIKGTSIADESTISINGREVELIGNLNVGSDTDKATLNLLSAEVFEDAKINLSKGSILKLKEESDININANDSINGDIIVEDGFVTIKNANITFGKESTTTTVNANNPYFELTTNDGLLIIEKAKLTMEDASKIKGGDFAILPESEFHSLSNGFSVDHLDSLGLVNAINDEYENYKMNNLVVSMPDASDEHFSSFALDIYAKDNASKKFDSFGSSSTVISGYDEQKNTGKIHISDFKVHGDLFGADAPTEKNIQLDIFNGTVKEGHQITFTATDKEIPTLLGYYKLTSNGNGSYTFGLSRMNPAAFRGQITKVAQYQNQLAINDMLFNHTMLNQGFKGNDLVGNNSPNRYASANDLYAPYQYSIKDGGLWFKSYANFERLNMNQGLSVGNNSYGSIIGADFGLKELKRGWSYMPTAYIGYNGANQYWNGNRAYQNGTQVGFLGTWYKDNLLLGALTYAGMYANSMDTPKGSDNTMNYYAGAATKTAYNIKLTKDISLQPNLIFAYSYFGQENWHTNFGQMGMMSGMLHGLNIAPGLNLIWEKETFSAYATVQYMYNLLQETSGRAGNIDIADVQMDRGYVQYGVGVNKKLTDRFSGYFQTVVRNAGRTGIGFQLGFNWKLGK